MKVKVSRACGALLAIVLSVALLLVLVGVSTRLASASALFRQGGGRPTPSPKPTRVVRHRKRHAPRTRPTTAAAEKTDSGNASNANNDNDAAGRNADVNANANESIRPRTTGAAGNANNDNGANNDKSTNAAAPSSTPNTAEPAGESNTQSAPADTSAPPKTPANTKPDADILLPDDLRELERPYFGSTSDPTFGGPTLIPPGLRPKPGNVFNPTSTLSEIANKRKVFVNVRGDYGNKVTARLKAYGKLEVVKTAGEAEFAVNYYDWAEEPPALSGIFDSSLRAKTITGGTLIITTRDPSAHMPRVIWRDDDTDGGWFKRGDAIDKLTKRFVNELKKLRGGK